MSDNLQALKSAQKLHQVKTAYLNGKYSTFQTLNILKRMGKSPKEAFEITRNWAQENGN